MRPELREGPSEQALLFQLPLARQVIGVFVKRTYVLTNGARMQPARDSLGLLPSVIDEDQAGTQPTACIVHESDLIPFKPWTDIVVHGHARSPGAVPVSSMMMALRLGELVRPVAVFGDRRVEHRRGTRPRFGAPQPFRELPLTWRRSYGGIDPAVRRAPARGVLDALIFTQPLTHPGVYPRNPSGTGWIVEGERELGGLLLPNFEDPEDLLVPARLICGTPEAWVHAPVPAGFGWFGQMWFPRSLYAGQIPTGIHAGSNLAEVHGGWLPADLAPLLDPERQDFDRRFFSGAGPGLRASHLRGDEALELYGFTHDGPLRSALPGHRPDVIIAFRRRPLPYSIALHTIELFPDDGLATLTWVALAEPPQLLPLSLPDPERLAEYDVLEGVDVMVDDHLLLQRTG